MFSSRPEEDPQPPPAPHEKVFVSVLPLVVTTDEKKRQENADKLKEYDKLRKILAEEKNKPLKEQLERSPCLERSL